MAGNKTSNTAATTAAVTNRIVVSADMKVGTYTIANASPVWGGASRITLTHTQVGGVTDTLGTVALVGKDLFGNAISETLTPVSASTVTSTKFFRSVTSATGAGWVVDTTADTIVIGVEAGNVVATGGGLVCSVTVNNSVAAAIVISDATGTLATIPASAAAGLFYRYDQPWSGFLKIATTSTNDVSVVHSTGVPSSYAMV